MKLDSITMKTNPIELYLRRVDAVRNMARHYSLSLEPTLFGELAIVRTWGRIGTHGQQKLLTFANPEEAVTELKKLALRKTRKGYIENSWLCKGAVDQTGKLAGRLLQAGQIVLQLPKQSEID